ncbi:hypothetical protein EVAR_21113_1 [Eumeta japonica]|uniref:Uncharacterized protein n=1 Tax=Eumeta variegata TaxID=151549 RepID=A0A4C1VV79_EUMVA|nr:hypothetical protein EVAR_21113_1 [Eumeta japonica]
MLALDITQLRLDVMRTTISAMSPPRLRAHAQCAMAASGARDDNATENCFDSKRLRRSHATAKLRLTTSSPDAVACCAGAPRPARTHRVVCGGASARLPPPAGALCYGYIGPKARYFEARSGKLIKVVNIKL